MKTNQNTFRSELIAVAILFVIIVSCACAGFFLGFMTAVKIQAGC